MKVLIATTGQRWEFQLKGSGQTPFSRNADGRAVLRSSVREFLAEEFMHAVGVSTTRALSLIVSGTETVERPWYDGRTLAERGVPTSVNDPRVSECVGARVLGLFACFCVIACICCVGVVFMRWLRTAAPTDRRTCVRVDAAG